MMFFRRAAQRAIVSPSSLQTSYQSISSASRSFTSITAPSLRLPLSRQTCLSTMMQQRFESSASKQGEDVKIIPEETSGPPPEAQNDTATKENSADAEVTATEGKTLSQEAGEPVAPHETTRDAFAAAPSAMTTGAGAGIPSRGGRGGETPYTRPRQELPANQTLYVGNLFFEVDESALKQEFEQYGAVQEAKIIYDHRGLSKGFGYITFSDVENARKAREQAHGVDFQGRPLAVNYQADRSNSRGRGGNVRPGQAEGKSRFQQRNDPSKTLFIGNMSYEMSDKDLNELFRNIKNVIDVRVAIDRNTGHPRGFAHADFEDVESALAAKAQLQDKEIYGRRLKIDFSESTPRSRTSSPRGE